MELAWIVSRDDEVEATLSDTSLGVRPPDERIPRAMQGTVLGDVFGRLARMNDGSRHDELRALVETRLAAWDLAEVRRLAGEAARLVDVAHIAGYVIASLIGLRDARALLPDIRDFADAVAAGADDETIARGIEATPRLIAALPYDGDDDRRANDLGFLFQAYHATARLLRSVLENRTDAPVALTRRYSAAGEKFVVLLADARFHFGAGPHRCPGRAIAETIAVAAAAALREEAARTAAADVSPHRA
jgi:cytochrome P450